MKRSFNELSWFVVFSLALNVVVQNAFASTGHETLKQGSKTVGPQGARKAKKKSEKEAEGSEARNRFEADTAIKSKYKINGDPLEVDPD